MADAMIVMDVSRLETHSLIKNRCRVTGYITGGSETTLNRVFEQSLTNFIGQILRWADAASIIVMLNCLHFIRSKQLLWYLYWLSKWNPTRSKFNIYFFEAFTTNNTSLNHRLLLGTIISPSFIEVLLYLNRLVFCLF